MSEQNDIGDVFSPAPQEDPTRESAKQAESKQEKGRVSNAKPQSGNRAATNPKTKKADKPKTVRIKLAHSKDIPPSGLYLGHNGRGYLLKPGVEADVPEFLLDVLDNAVASKPVVDQGGRVKGYEEQPRFMYSIARDKK